MTDCSTGSYRTGDLLQIDIRAGERQRCIYLGGSGSVPVLYINDHILYVRFGCGKIDSIPLGGTCLLAVTGLPVEIDVGLTSLTFAYVFETSVEVNIPGNFGYQVDILYVAHTLEHVLLVNHDLFLVRSEFVGSIAGTVSRYFECHLNGYRSIGGTCVAIGKLRLVLAERVHVSHLDAVVMDSCAHRFDRVRYVQILPNDTCSRDNRRSGLSHCLHLDRDLRLHVLDTEIEFVGLHRDDHAARNGVDHGLTGSEGVLTLGNTGGRAVKRLTHFQVHRFGTGVGDGDLRILVSRILDGLQVHFPPCRITRILRSSRSPSEGTGVLTGLIQVSSFKHFRTQFDFSVGRKCEINLRLFHTHEHRSIGGVGLVLARGNRVVFRLRLPGHCSLHTYIYRSTNCVAGVRQIQCKGRILFLIERSEVHAVPFGTTYMLYALFPIKVNGIGFG